MSCISKRDLFDDSDAFTDKIFEAQELVKYNIKADVARPFIDLNRPPDAIPPAFPDGVVKSRTCYRKPIYKQAITKETTDKLLANYYFPYHNKIKNIVQDTSLILGLDCHSMAEKPPPIAPDNHDKRPLINLGNAYGNACDFETTELLAQCFEEIFFIEPAKISINKPFAGGYITKTYGNNPLPWIQIEMNRGFYLHEKWFDSEKLMMKSDRIKELNQRFLKTIVLFYERLTAKRKRAA